MNDSQKAGSGKEPDFLRELNTLLTQIFQWMIAEEKGKLVVQWEIEEQDKEGRLEIEWYVEIKEKDSRRTTELQGRSVQFQSEFLGRQCRRQRARPKEKYPNREEE